VLQKFPGSIRILVSSEIRPRPDKSDPKTWALFVVFLCKNQGFPLPLIRRFPDFFNCPRVINKNHVIQEKAETALRPGWKPTGLNGIKYSGCQNFQPCNKGPKSL
jgi:hypothetical protein